MRFILTLAFAATLTAADVHFGPTTISSLETARLAAYCDGSVVPVPCLVTFEFKATDGSVLLSRSLTMQPGTTAFADLPAERAGIQRGHGQIDPCWDIERGAALISLEIFSTGNQRTRLSIGWGDRSMPRTGDIDFAPAGITGAETARLGALCPDDGRAAQACRVTLEFHDVNGRVLKQADLVLRPGASGFLDLHFVEAAAIGRRGLIEPCMKVGDGGPVVGTLAIIDDGTGQPAVQTYPATLAIGAQ